MSNTIILEVILRGLPNTLYLLVLSFVFATNLGSFLAWLDLRKSRLAKGVANL